MEESKQLSEMCLVDADALVGYGKTERNPAIVSQLSAGLEGDVALLAELDRVVDKLGEHLSDSLLVTQNPARAAILRLDQLG